MSIIADYLHQDYNIEADAIVHLAEPDGNNSETQHNHVVIVLPNGGEMWLDIGTNQDDHDFTDIRWFNPAGQMKGTGVFTIVNGYQRKFEGEPMLDTEGTPVKGHGWNGGYVTTLLVDKYGQESAAIKPSNGNG